MIYTARTYIALRENLTEAQIKKLKSDMETVHQSIKEIIEESNRINCLTKWSENSKTKRHIYTTEEVSDMESKKLEALFKEYDLCQYLAGSKVDDLKAIISRFGKVPIKVRTSGNKGTLCYIVLSVLTMDPKEFAENLTKINKPRTKHFFNPLKLRQYPTIYELD